VHRLTAQQTIGQQSSHAYGSYAFLTWGNCQVSHNTEYGP